MQTVANQLDISLQTAIDRYAWNDDFALMVAEIREAFPGAFTGGEIVDDDNAWVAFADSAPQAARDIINTFSSSHSGVSVEVRTDLGFTEVELQDTIAAYHFAVFGDSVVADAVTSFDFATNQMETMVVLNSTASDSIIDDLRAKGEEQLTSDILGSITTSVVRSPSEVLGGEDHDTKHMGGEILRTCTSGFGTKDSSGTRGISTAGHCSNSQSDDGSSLTFKGAHFGTHGDFQWHTGPDNGSNEFYSGSATATEDNDREVTSVGSPTVGQWLCRNGVTSHKDCQKVRKLNVSRNGAQNLVQMEKHYSAGGDSGGPVFWGNAAYGIHYGWMYDPNTTKREVFSRADRIDDALSISIATD